MDDPLPIWSNRLDNRFVVRVDRIDGDTARFTVTDTVNPLLGGLGTLASEVVPLICQAAYGPDFADVARWMDRGIEVVDAAMGSAPPAPAEPVDIEPPEEPPAPVSEPISDETWKTIYLTVVFLAMLGLTLYRCSWEDQVREMRNSPRFVGQP